MSAANFESYLAGTWAVGRDGAGALVVGVGNPLVRATLEQRFRQHIKRAVFEVAGERTGLVLLHVADRAVDDEAAGVVEMQG